MLRFLVCGMLTILSAGRASALIEAQLQYGPSWTEQKLVDGSSAGTAWDIVTLSVHVDPIPLIPISFGAAYSMATVKDRDLDSRFSSYEGSELGLEVMAWLPFVPIVTPYGRLTMPITGSYTATSNTAGVSDVNSDRTGGQVLSAGLRYGLLPLTEIVLEASKGVLMSTPEGGNEEAMDVTSVRLGVAIGI